MPLLVDISVLAFVLVCQKNKDQIRNCHSDKEEGKSAPPVTIECDSSVFFKSKWAEAVLSRSICPIIYIKVHCSSA